MLNNCRQHVLEIAQAGTAACRPESCIPRFVSLQENKLAIDDRTYDLEQFENVYILGAGKASASMARQIELILGSKMTKGCVVTKYGHQEPCSYIDVLEAAHPVPDQSSLDASRKILNIAENATDKDLVLFLLSGGASALFECLPEGVTLDDLQKTNELLLRSGATISEINSVRRQLSLVKGGRLAASIAPARLVTLIIVDTPGDDLAAVGSGPTVPLPTSSYQLVLDRYPVLEDLPATVKKFLADASQIKPFTVDHVQNVVVAKNALAMKAASVRAQEMGYVVHFFDEQITTEVRDAAKRIRDDIVMRYEAEPHAKQCLLWGGETTVAMQGQGKGGRNQELALRVMQQLRDLIPFYVFLSFATDGNDGPTDAAGGVVTSQNWLEIDQNELSYSLERNDSYEFLRKMKSLVRTGPTGTNVMDLMLCLVDGTRIV